MDTPLSPLGSSHTAATARRAAASAEYRAAQEELEPGWLARRLEDPEFCAAYLAASGAVRDDQSQHE